MVEIRTENVRMNPTLRLVDTEGRATSEFQRFLRLAIKVIEAINIVDGEITTEMLADLAVQASKLDDGAVVVGKLAAGAIYVSTLFADEVVITSKVAQKAITEVTIAEQGAPTGPAGNTVLSADVPLTDSGTTGINIQFTGFMDRPLTDAGNFGYWAVDLYKNGVFFDTTPPLFYDDNFSYQPIAVWTDDSPGMDPHYDVVTRLIDGPGNFVLTNSVSVFTLFKR